MRRLRLALQEPAKWFSAKSRSDELQKNRRAKTVVGERPEYGLVELAASSGRGYVEAIE
jgi:hypothetical protein